MEDPVPVLVNRQAFEEALASYQISDHGREVLARTPLVALSGLAGGGRNTVIRYLAQHFNYMFVVSDTTRPPKLRDGRMEQNGIHYFFRSEHEVLHDIRNGEYIEAEIIHNQQVSGTSIREVERVAATGRIPIHDFEYKGANNVARVKPDAHIIGLLPPSYDEWLRRLYGREAIKQQEFLNRLETAQYVLENLLSKPYFRIVISEEVSKCADDIREIVETNHYEPEKEIRAQHIAEQILGRVKEARQQAVTLQ